MATNCTAWAGSAAAARSAAIFGPASRAFADQPAFSRMFVKASRSSAPASAATSRNSGASCVHPTVIGAPELAAAAARDRRRVERHRLLAGAGENNALVVHVSVPDGGFLPPLALVIPLLYWNRSKERARDLGSHRRSQ